MSPGYFQKQKSIPNRIAFVCDSEVGVIRMECKLSWECPSLHCYDRPVPSTVVCTPIVMIIASTTDKRTHLHPPLEP